MSSPIDIILIIDNTSYKDMNQPISEWTEGLIKEWPRNKGNALVNPVNEYFNPHMWAGSFDWFPPVELNKLIHLIRKAGGWPQILIKEDGEDQFHTFNKAYLNR